VLKEVTSIASEGSPTELREDTLVMKSFGTKGSLALSNLLFESGDMASRPQVIPTTKVALLTVRASFA
jgi:hypothetical protein